MANILPVSNMINQPNLLGAAQQGLQFGQQQRALREQRADQSQLRTLAPQIIAGDPGATAQAAVIDPQAAGQYQGAGDAIARRAEGLVRLLEEADKRDPREAQALWQTHGVPFARQFSKGTEPTTDWAQAKPMLANLKARIEMAKAAQNPTADPTGYREAHMKAIAAGYLPGSPDYQRAMRVSLGTEAGLARTQPKTITTDINGVPTTLTFDPGTQSYRIAEITGSGQPSPTRQVIGPDGRPLDLSGIADPRMREEIEGNPALWQVAPDGAEVRMPDQRPQGGMPIIGRTAEAEAAAVESAKQGVQTQFMTEQERIKRESAIQEAAGKAEAEARVKREADLATAAQKKYVDATTTLGLLDEAEALLDKSTGSRLGAARDAAAATFGHSTEGAQAIAALQPIAASLTLAVPRMEGPQSDADRLLYQKAAGDFANPEVPVPTRKAAMATMRTLANKYRETGGRPLQAPQQSRAPLPAGFSWED